MDLKRTMKRILLMLAKFNLFWNHPWILTKVAKGLRLEKA